MSDSRARIWFALFVLAVFCAGAATGALVVWRLGPPRPGVAWQARGPDGPARLTGPGRPGRLIDRLDRALQLTPDQEAAIKRIFETRQEPLQRAQREMRERIDQEQRELTAEIRKVLTAEQQAKFDRWLEEERARGRGRGRGTPFGPPGERPGR